MTRNAAHALLLLPLLAGCAGQRATPSPSLQYYPPGTLPAPQGEQYSPDRSVTAGPPQRSAFPWEGVYWGGTSIGPILTEGADPSSVHMVTEITKLLIVPSDLGGDPSRYEGALLSAANRGVSSHEWITATVAADGLHIYAEPRGAGSAVGAELGVLRSQSSGGLVFYSPPGGPPPLPMQRR